MYGEGYLLSGEYSLLLYASKFITFAIVCNVTAAVYASCQELTSTLRNESHACRGDEVIFTCTIRGSPILTTLVLAWSSTEYIGGNPLRFTTQDTPGENNLTSEINGNVIATLISNTDINGVPTLVSELRIVADQASTVTCGSQATSRINSTMFHVSGTYNIHARTCK